MKVTSIKVRMYRGGTGDCFLLQFKQGAKITFNMMIDCGCINGGKKEFEPIIADIKLQTKGKIDLLAVTHEHADHINGFQKSAQLFDSFTFKRVWFAWTEDKEDKLANDFRKHHSEIKFALASASLKLNALVKDKYYDTIFKDEAQGELMVAGKNNFIRSLDQVNALNFNAAKPVKGKGRSMADLFVDYNVIKEDTEVEFLEPGQLVKNIAGATGIRFFVLGPPRDYTALSLTEKEGESYHKREAPSTFDSAFAAALNTSNKTESDYLPFESHHELKVEGKVKDAYERENWRKIDNDWLFSAGSLALRFEKSINNTSLALAIQFEESEKVLLFPGDAEYGNWRSWHDGLAWKVTIDGKQRKVNAEYLLNNTVFYKVGHHFSQNGTAKKLGVDMMVHEDLVAMSTLDFRKINTGWLNTMPNDLLAADLISKTKGKLFFSGECAKIFPNIKTDRVTIKKGHETNFTKLNKAFDKKVFVEYEVKG